MSDKRVRVTFGGVEVMPDAVVKYTTFPEPGYRFRLGQGDDTVVPIRDLLKYGQEFAAKEYGKVFDRADRARRARRRK